MNRICRKLQEKLAEGGPGALREDPKGQRHLEQCGACFAMLESVAQLDEALAELPQSDASDTVVVRLLGRPELLLQGATANTSAITSPRHLWQRWLAAFSTLGKLDPVVKRSVASLAVVVLAVGLASMVLSLAPALRQAGGEASWSKSTSAPVDQGAPLSSRNLPALAGELGDGEDSGVEAKERDAAMLKKMQALGYAASGGSYEEDDDGAEAQRKSELGDPGLGAMGDLGGVFSDQVAPLSESEAEVVVGGKLGGRLAQDRSDLLEQVAPLTGADKDQPASILMEESITPGDLVAAYSGAVAAPKAKAKGVPRSSEAGGKASESMWVGTESNITFRGGSPRVESETKELFADPAQEEVRQRLRKRLNELPRRVEDRREAGQRAETLADQKPEESKHEARVYLQAPHPVKAPALADGDLLAEIFLEERARLDGVALQPAEGYWANTYVPGDPALRHLQASLLRRDRSALEAFTPTPLRLHDAVRQPTQPFDPPESAALAVYLHADHAALEGSQRLLLQVGLQASERLGGRRPAMNLGVVLDLRGEISTSSATTLRALMTAFAQTRDLGDRFRLLVAGRPGGEVVGPEAFHHGPVAVTLERLLTGEGAEGVTLGLSEALAIAAEVVGRDDDPTSPLGSSAVILITDQPLATDSAALGRLAHRSALKGVTISVIGVGERIGLDELENLALAGQGHRRLLHVPGEATAVVERELAAVGRAVARAVRLRIRLAPGVELIDVLGSHRLDVAAAERVRQAEQSIDRRLSKNLGITADRGDDEDGLQIIIPSFYAGDSHVVLLDVVAPGPGPLVDVRVRYKDLVYFENGVARSRLTLDRGVREAGPLERNVFKNLLATDAHGIFEEAGQLLRGGDPEAARERLETFRQLLLGLGRALPDLAKDRDLERDIALLGEYVTLLNAGAASADEVRSHLADSLRLSGRLKVLPRSAASGDL